MYFIFGQSFAFFTVITDLFSGFKIYQMIQKFCLILRCKTGLTVYFDLEKLGSGTFRTFLVASYIFDKTFSVVNMTTIEFKGCVPIETNTASFAQSFNSCLIFYPLMFLYLDRIFLPIGYFFFYVFLTIHIFLLFIGDIATMNVTTTTCSTGRYNT